MSQQHEEDMQDGKGTAALKLTGAQVVANSLLSNGVEVIFGFPGGSVIPLYDEILARREKLRHILTRHEQGAIHAAQAYARVTGRAGVVIATSGPGASNLITGIMDAHLDSTPLVVIGGQVSTNLIGNDAFQECDMMCMTNPITKHNFQVRDVETLGQVIDEAFHIATTGRPGPVYIDLPKDVQTHRTSKGQEKRIDLPCYVDHRSLPEDRVQQAIDVIRAAKRPLLLLGQGAVLASAWEELRALACELDIPVATTILAKGAFDERHPLSVGCVGMHGRRVANYTIAHCDVLLAFGCRFSDRITGDPKAFAEGKQIIHVDIDPYEIGKNVPAAVEVNADARDAARAMHEHLKGYAGGWTAWTTRVKSLRDICNRCKEDAPSEALHPKEVIRALDAVLADDDIVTTGVGQHQMFVTHYLNRSKPRTLITSGGAGTMGFGLPAAIGAAIGQPKVNVWAVDGDGSLQMTIQELGTITSCGAKVIIVLLDNGYLGMVRQWQELYCDRRYSSVDLAENPDFSMIAHAYGIEAILATRMEDLQQAFQYAKGVAHSVLIHVPVERESNIMPMIPPAGKVTDFQGYCISEPGRFFQEDEEQG